MASSSSVVTRSKPQELLRAAGQWLRGCFYAALITHAIFPVYKTFILWANLSDALMFTIITCAIHTGLYFGINTFLLWAESKGMFQQYKLDRNKSNTPSSELIWKTIRTNALAQFTQQPLSFYFVVWPLFQFFGAPSSLAAPIPSVLALVPQFFMCVVFNEFFFYWTHRAMHASQWFYVHVHKQHHQYSGPVGFASEHAHWAEQLISNQMPTIGGALLCGFHPLVWFIWLAWRLFITYENHSGFAFRPPLLVALGIFDPDSAQHHDRHHSINTGNYGSRLLDTLFDSTIPNQQIEQKRSE